MNLAVQLVICSSPSFDAFGALPVKSDQSASDAGARLSGQSNLGDLIEDSDCHHRSEHCSLYYIYIYSNLIYF